GTVVGQLGRLDANGPLWGIWGGWPGLSVGQWPPPPGFWICVLGFLAGTVTVFPAATEQLSPLQRGGAVALFFLLMVLEVRSLSRERDRQDSNFAVILGNFQE